MNDCSLAWTKLHRSRVETEMRWPMNVRQVGSEQAGFQARALAVM